MEFSFNIFWIIKVAFGVAFAYSVYTAYKKEFKSYFWNVVMGVLLLIGIFTPVRMEQSNLNRVHIQETTQVENSKALPEMVSDDSFAMKVAEKKEITKEELK